MPRPPWHLPFRLVPALLAACASTSPTAPPTPAVGACLAKATAAGFSGLVLVATGDRVLARFAAGSADPVTGLTLRPDTLFRFASVTKQMTAVLVMQAVAAGRFRLDDTVAQLWPECPVPNAARITVRQLLQHRSGLPDPEARSAFTDPALVGLDHQALVRTLPDTAAAEPGAGFAYNNADYWLLGALLERSHGQPFAAILRAGILAPAGMHGAGLYQHAGPAPADHARGHLGAERRPEPAYQLAVYGAAGAANGTLDDLLAFDRALLRGTLLPQAAFLAMTTADEQGAALGVWSYQLALPAEPMRVVERQGWIGGIKVLNLISPSHDLIVAVMTDDDRLPLDATWSGTGLGAELLQAAALDLAARTR
jgi:D-alanyl-D-alanine carboxypeptidase